MNFMCCLSLPEWRKELCSILTSSLERGTFTLSCGGREVRLGHINCREGFVSQLVFLSADIYHAAPEIHLVEEAAPVHTVFRMIFNELSFELELYDRDSLMHFCGERVFY